MIRSLRLRITVWYVAFFSVLFVLFGLFLYHVLERSLVTRLDESLVSQAETTAALLDDELHELQGDADRAAHEAVGDMRIAGHVAIVAEGRVLGASSAIPPEELAAILAPAGSGAGQDRVIQLPRHGAQGARAALYYARHGGRNYVVYAVAPLDSIAGDLAVVRRVLWYAMPLLVMLAAVGGYGLSSRSLAPLGWMAEQARQISGSSLDRRLEIGRAAAELTVLAASFNELLGRLDQSFESMKRFVADASHELRTPISVVRGEADVALSQERSPAEYKAALAIILDESRRLSRLVDDLLNLARADAGKVRLRLEALYLNDLVAECCRSMQSLAAARHIELACATNGDAAFRGDEELLRRLVINLLDNGIRYTPPGGKVTAALESSGSDFRIVVCDSGPGIPPEAAPHVFERFYRADKARSREDGGFGLGLAIVKWIAESHRGTVGLASRPGEGTTFTVTLPR